MACERSSSIPGTSIEHGHPGEALRIRHRGRQNPRGDLRGRDLVGDHVGREQPALERGEHLERSLLVVAGAGRDVGAGRSDLHLQFVVVARAAGAVGPEREDVDEVRAAHELREARPKVVRVAKDLAAGTVRELEERAVRAVRIHGRCLRVGPKAGDVHRVDDAVRTSQENRHHLELILEGRVAEALVAVDLPELSRDDPFLLLGGVLGPDEQPALEAFGQIDDVLAAGQDVEDRREVIEGLDHLVDLAAPVPIVARVVHRPEGFQGVRQSALRIRTIGPPGIAAAADGQRLQHRLVLDELERVLGPRERGRKAERVDRAGELHAVGGEAGHQPHALLDREGRDGGEVRFGHSVEHELLGRVAGLKQRARTREDQIEEEQEAAAARGIHLRTQRPRRLLGQVDGVEGEDLLLLAVVEELKVRGRQAADRRSVPSGDADGHFHERDFGRFLDALEGDFRRPCRAREERNRNGESKGTVHGKAPETLV